jgi:hypothetical protein
MIFSHTIQRIDLFSHTRIPLMNIETILLLMTIDKHILDHTNPVLQLRSIINHKFEIINHKFELSDIETSTK